MSAHRRPDPNPEARALKIAKLWGLGLSSQQISERLSISRDTVDRVLRQTGHDRSASRRRSYNGVPGGGRPMDLLK